MIECSFVVLGIPRPQGSKRALKNGIMVEQSKYVGTWRSTIALKAGQEWKGRPLIETPCMIQMDFYFPRPNKHFGSGKNKDLLRDNAPYWYTSAPDLDKLQRAVLDALKGVILKDDRYVVDIEATKRYDSQPALVLTIESTR